VSPRMQEMYPPINLGETAENVAERYQVSRERQDEFALRSHRRAARAQDEGRFDGEIVPVSTEGGELRCDEGVRPGLTIGELAAKRPAFRKGGTVTGGNSSPLNDGAAGLLLVSERALPGVAGAAPMARYVGTAAAGVHPDYMGIGPVPALGKVLGRAQWQVEGLDLIEVNEAFAAQAVAVADELKLDPDRVNVNGGAIAIGHPLGCSGARITTTLLHEFRRRGAARAAASMCIGVGQGIATLWESA
jgi:acetyl-CoA acyltransferase